MRNATINAPKSFRFFSFRIKPVDLQLPTPPEIEATPEPVQAPVVEAKIKFREKKVDSLGSELIAFKKRKLAQRSMKQRQER